MNFRLDFARAARGLVPGGVLLACACGGLAEDPTIVRVVIDPAARHQTLVGFGAATAYKANLLSGRTDDIFQTLFVDSGLDILRLGNWYQNQATLAGAPATTSTAFGDYAEAQIVQKATAARGGVPPTILMSAWTPPAYLKSNGVTRPAPGSSTAMAGTLSQVDGAFAYADYADWWVRSLQAYAAAGVVPDYVSIQNEPDFYTSYWETCVWGPTEGAKVADLKAAGYGEALRAVRAAVAASSLASQPVLLGPETDVISDRIVQKYLDGLDQADLGGIAYHLYGSTEDNPNPDWFESSLRDVARSTASTGLPGFMTEYSPNAPTLIETAWLIHNTLTLGGASAYIYWELIWSATPPTGLVTITGPSPSSPYVINDTYYALKHFARWTDPGWIRVDAGSSSPTLRASAFLSPDGASLTLVLINPGDRDHLVAVQPGAFAFGARTVYRSAGASERTTMVAPESDGSILMPARSIATVTYTP